MEPVQIVALVVSLAISLVAIALFVKAIRHIIAVIKLGQPAPNRSNDKGSRWAMMLKETLAHTRMLQWTAVGIGHWFIFVGFGLLFATLLNAYGQLFDAHFILPIIGHFPPFEWVTEFFAWAMVLAIIPFIVYRATRPSERERGPKGRLYGSTMWQGYFVELVILTVGICILLLRFFEYALGKLSGEPDQVTALHFPFTFWAGELFTGMSEPALENAIWITAAIKIIISMTWMIVLAQNTTMGVAWHRFTAWFNIWFKRRSDGGTSLGALQPMMAGGVPIDFENMDELDEETALGVGKAEDFAWKGILDFNSCTECGRCQSQCPAWNTDKPLSPKLLITNLRDHTYAKAPYLLASSDEERDALPDTVKAEAERELVGATEGYAWEPSGGAVIDPDVLWSCTSCGACVQQCPVDIEHVDHIMDMRRYQVLVESNFPTELNQLFKGLENKGNPWNMSPNARLDWAKDLPFEVKVVGEDVEDLDEVDWLFWVGCAGAYEDRAKKTTRAVAELLDMAGVDFAVLGNGETCNGDPARRAGNEFVFQQLAMQNAEVFKETKVKKVVATCAHCFNTLKNEYGQFGVELEVVHHTQLLNRLVREGKLTPVATNGTPGRSITYHDPCYLGRHNQVYSPPRELLNVIPNAELKEMPRNSERSFCCGAGGARMWMEEKIGERINLNRTTEAIETGADQIATGCPFCRVMLSDGLTAKQADGSAREEVEVLDVAQLLLASVKRADTAVAAPAAASTASASGSGDGGTTDVATGSGTATAVMDRPDPDPDAVSAPATDSGSGSAPATGAGSESGSASDSGSLFGSTPDSSADTETTTSEPKPADDSDSLFDSEPDPKPAAEATKPEPKPTDDSDSLSDSEPDPKPAAEATKPEPKPADDSGSLFGSAPDPDSDSLFGSAAGSGADTEATKSEPDPGDVTQTENTVSDTQDVGANAAATEEKDPEVESTKPDAGEDEPAGAGPDDVVSADPAEQTEPVDAANTDPDSADVTSADISEEESTAPDGDAAVQNLEQAGPQAPSDEAAAASTEPSTPPTKGRTTPADDDEDRLF